VMHRHEKSDSAIVAKKPPNKAGKPGAEAVERRAGAKGNTVSKARAGLRSGKACPRRWTVCGKLQGKSCLVLAAKTPEVGAECLNWARSDLCGGSGVTRFPTAIIST